MGRTHRVLIAALAAVLALTGTAAAGYSLPTSEESIFPHPFHLVIEDALIRAGWTAPSHPPGPVPPPVTVPAAGDTLSAPADSAAADTSDTADSAGFARDPAVTLPSSGCSCHTTFSRARPS